MKLSRVVTLMPVVLAGLVAMTTLGAGTASAMPASRAAALGLNATTASTAMCNLTDPSLTESSGLARSWRFGNVSYTIQDAGHSAQVFAVSTVTCNTLAVLTLADVSFTDVEAVQVASGPGGVPTVYVGDIGDNLHNQTPGVVHIYRFAEPATLADATVYPDTITLSYPDGAHNAETLLIPNDASMVTVVTKGAKGTWYTAAMPTDLSTTTVLTRGRTQDYTFTDGAYFADGRVVLRTYKAARIYASLTGTLNRQASLPGTGTNTGEGVSISADGSYLMTSKEGQYSTVWKVPLG